MADQLIQEIDDALRADKFSAFLREHKNLFIGIALALILGTAANSIWERHREVKGGEVLASLSESQKLLQAGKAEQAAAGFKKIADGASGEFKDLALVWQSRALIKADKKEEAIAALKLAVADGGNLWSDIACLRLAGLDGKAATACLAASTKSPLASTRAEWNAANLWVEGKHDDAIKATEALLADKDLAAADRARLSDWLSVMKGSK